MDLTWIGLEPLDPPRGYSPSFQAAHTPLWENLINFIVRSSPKMYIPGQGLTLNQRINDPRVKVIRITCDTQDMKTSNLSTR
ncbi:hypothetical protein M8J76_012804 [Diaphorina citri]|nr:hypothetical protein M8J75_004943 [Diaphorina citri]KAI5737366.1 hypothetical protein M8J76_012804 [Diaphorina citri]